MENASNALLMAGGILIAIIIIGLLVSMFSNASEFQMSQLSQKEQEELIAFNEQYTKYLNQYVYGTEVLTLQNKYNNDGEVNVILTHDSEQPTATDNRYEYDEDTDSYSNETRYYKCINITYDNLTGKVNSITFKQIKMSSET